MSPLLMQENGNGVADPSPASAPGQDDTPSVFFHSAKLRNKLEKLAQWRVDPSLIEFPPDSREFTGGFATVSQGLWASNPSPAEDRTNKSEHTTNEHLSSEAGRLHSDKDPQESEEDHQGKDEEADGRAIDCNNDQTNGEERKDNDQERKPQDQSSILRVEVGSGALGHIADEDQDLENRNPQPQGDTQEPDDGQKDQNEGINHLQKADDDNEQTKDEARKESNSSNEERHSHQPLKPKVGNKSASRLCERIL
ncbi:hypothetical protein FS837_008185 [Tulasnella sp. UAMH 9824]|nr:hypothetical protein FS837_008185 [Tulasnella sp. UAMH 9824]